MTKRPLIYIADDEQGVLDALYVLVTRKMNCQARLFATATEAIEALSGHRPELVITDISFDGKEAGIDVLRASRRKWPDVPVILMSAVASREAAIQAVNEKAFHFLEKPFRNDDMLQVLRAALDYSAVRSRARGAVDQGRHAKSRRHNHPGATAAAARTEGDRALCGESPAFLETLALVEQSAATDVTVLLEGESGVGKGVLAAYLHQCSPRRARPFLSVNCGALAETLLESQLFGHVRGSFTGADRDQPGLVRAAHAGTLFLDEVSELTPATQVKLLRVLQEREVIPVGGVETHTVDVRFIAASNRDLRKQVAAGRFREDLFWRLNVMAIRIPALRERPDDVPLLAEQALAKLRARDAGIRARAIHPEALARLSAYSWPGNVRELENAIERAAVVSGEVIRPEDLPGDLAPGARAAGAAFPALTSMHHMLALEVVEQAYVSWVLQRSGGDANKAAATLGIPVRVLLSIVERQST
jgi:DNA-binding NtrC family response regulator